MIIRTETESDYALVHALVKKAFETAKLSDGTEAEYLAQLRKGKNFIPGLSFVAEVDGRIVGQVILTRTVIQGKRCSYPSLLLSPISVDEAYRNRGIGGTLIRHSFHAAHAQGYTSVFLVGNPLYYHRFGFRPTADYGIRHPSIPQQFVQCVELIPGALKGIHGTVDIV